MTISGKSLVLATTALVAMGTAGHADPVTREAALAQTSVYRVGFPVEVSIEAGEGLGGEEDLLATNATAAKHYALGRLSYEPGYVMPDKRTVYIGNDETNGGMFRFHADAEGDLSAGELFAAKLTRAAEKGARTSSFKIGRISLGHATDAEVDALIAKAASRLETARSAAVRGATSERCKMEGVAFDARKFEAAGGVAEDFDKYLAYFNFAAK